MKDDVTLITGASSDIGRGLISEMLASWDVVSGKIVAHAFSGTEKLEALKSEFPNLSSCLEIVKADLASESELNGLIEVIRARHNFPTRVVHLAAPKLALQRAAEFEWQTLLAGLEIQLKSIGAIMKAFLPSMAKSGRPCKVVFMLSSTTVGMPPKHMTQYTIGKYALLGFLRSLAVEYADKPICFNGVSPSMVETQFLSSIPEKFVEMTAAVHPKKRNASVSDVVPAIRFLLSPESDYISGVNIPITAASVM